MSSPPADSGCWIEDPNSGCEARRGLSSAPQPPVLAERTLSTYPTTIDEQQQERYPVQPRPQSGSHSASDSSASAVLATPSAPADSRAVSSCGSSERGGGEFDRRPRARSRPTPQALELPSVSSLPDWLLKSTQTSPVITYDSLDLCGPSTVVPELHKTLTTPRASASGGAGLTTLTSHHSAPNHTSLSPSLGRLDSMPAPQSPLSASHARSPLAKSHTFQLSSSGSSPSGGESSSARRAPSQPPAAGPSTSFSAAQSSPFFIHSHLDNSLNETLKRDAQAAASVSAKKRGKKADSTPELAQQQGTSDQESETVSEGDAGSYSNEDESFYSDEEEQNSLTRQLAETAVSVREMSKQLGRARVVSHIQSVMIITKARDNHLITLTRELALWLMATPRNGRDRGLVVYVDQQLKKSKRFDAEGLEREHADLFRPFPRRYSRTSSAASLAGSVVLDPHNKRMTPLTQITEAIKKTGLGGTETPGGRKGEGVGGEEGQLRYWTNEMCTKSPHLFDFVITLGGDGTVLYASWLFQHVVPPVIPFALGSLGFLTNFDFSTYAYTLNHAIDSGIRVNLRMRFTCTVYRAIEPEDSNKKRRAVKSGKTGAIFMNSLTKDGWEALESGGTKHKQEPKEGSRLGKKDKEIKCFSTRPVESFEVLNDLVVDRGPSPYVSLLELFGDEHHMTTVQADGLTVSTPTGSTAYSLSAGGSLVHPEIPALLITPICPHTLSFRPMLLPDSMELRICVPYNSRSTAWASFDGRGRVELRQGDHIKVTASQYPFPTVCADKQSTDWFGSISRTLKWNERQRQKSFVILEEGSKHKARDDPAATTGSTPHGGETPPAAAFSNSNGRASDEATKRAKADFGDEEDEPTSTDGEDDDDDDECVDDDEEEEEEEEAFDIDDLSTNPSSPVTHATDLGPLPAALSALASDSAQGERPSLEASSHQHGQSSTSSVDLQDDTTCRFHSEPPRPPRLSSRHSATDSAAAAAAAKRAADEHNRRIAESQARRRARGEEGDRDYLHEPMRSRRGKSQTRKRATSASRARQPGPPLSEQQMAEAHKHPDRAFAVVGNDSETSLSDLEY